MPQLDITSFISQLFWFAVTFALLYVFLARISLPRVRNVLQDRQSRIESDLQKAAAMKEEAEAARSYYTSGLDEARKKAGDLIEEATASIRKQSRERHAKLDETLARQLEEADARVGQIRQKAIDEIGPISEEIAELIVAKLLGSAEPKKNKAVGAA
jgi:F-type H+-transporting ATPase subunit b